MKKIKIAVFVMFCTYLSVAFGQNGVKDINTTLTPKIRIYFNTPVNTAVSNGVNAIYLNGTMADTLIAYINKAKYTIDAAVYEYEAPTSIGTALNNAYTRGVKIRWIYDGSMGLNSLSSVNSGIPKLASPTGGNYNIMHNKFVIIDANSANANDPWVWTGSANWTSTMWSSDVNNVILFQDQPLAQAYTMEFNQMWGGSGMTPVPANEKFGPDKSDITPHNFTIGGIPVELYFSPSDGTNSHILSAINSATEDLYFGVYTFTEGSDASAIVAVKNKGINTAGICDQYSEGSSAYSTLTSGLGTMFKTYSQNNTIYHSKMCIVDPCTSSTTALVETGSHNWTSTADNTNDENIVIVHSPVVANIYYQWFNKSFTSLGGSVTNVCKDVGLVPEYDLSSSLLMYPNPCSDYFVIKSTGQDNLNQVQIQLFDILGNEIIPQITRSPDSFEINVENLKEGIYFLKLITSGAIQTKRIEVIK